MATGSEQLKMIEEEAATLLKAEPQSAVALRQRLMKKGYERPAITKALAKIDWVEQARRVADPQFHQPEVGPDLLTAYLAGHGFTVEERREAVSSFDWRSRAVFYVADCLHLQPIAETKMRATLKSAGFTDAQVDEAFKLSPVDWSAVLDDAIAEMLKIGASRKAIINRLGDFGHDAAEVRRRLRALRVNWNEEALRALISLEFAEVEDYDWLDQDLHAAGFTLSQAAWAHDALRSGKPEAAPVAAELYLETRAVSEANLRKSLVLSEFTDDVIDRTADALASVDWMEACVPPIRRIMRYHYPASRSGMVKRLKEGGYSAAQIRRAFSEIKPDWNDRAYRTILTFEPKTGVLDRELMDGLLATVGFTIRQIDWALARRYGKMSPKAWAYSRACFMGVNFPSKKAIRGALTHGGFSKSVVDDAMRNLWFDWREHAFRQAQMLVDTGSRRGHLPYPATILQYLSDLGFTKTETRGVIDKLPVDWAQIASEVIEDEMNSCCGMPYIDSLLKERQFPPAAVEAGKRLARVDEINWKEQAKFSLAKALETQYQEPEQIRRVMLARGLTEEEVDYAFSHTVIPSNVDWNERALAVAREMEEDLHLSPQELKARLVKQQMSERQVEYVMKHIRINVAREAEARAVALLRGGMPPELVSSALLNAGFPARHVRAVANAIGMIFPD